MSSMLTRGLDFQAQALVLRSERQRLIASNIANADTPGYVARDFDFAQALRQAAGGVASGAAGSTTSPASGLTHAAHQPLNGRAPLEPTLNYALAAQPNLDGNTVDMDRERASFADNAVKYEATLRFINSGSRTMLDAMKSHNS